MLTSSTAGTSNIEDHSELIQKLSGLADFMLSANKYRASIPENLQEKLLTPSENLDFVSFPQSFPVFLKSLELIKTEELMKTNFHRMESFLNKFPIIAQNLKENLIKFEVIKDNIIAARDTRFRIYSDKMTALEKCLLRKKEQCNKLKNSQSLFVSRCDKIIAQKRLQELQDLQGILETEKLAISTKMKSSIFEDGSLFKSQILLSSSELTLTDKLKRQLEKSPAIKTHRHMFTDIQNFLARLFGFESKNTTTLNSIGSRIIRLRTRPKPERLVHRR